MDRIYFVSGSTIQPRVLRAVQVERARSVLVLPSQAVTRTHLKTPAMEARRIVDSDTILTTNIIATRHVTKMGTCNDVWTVTQLVGEGSLGRFFGMAPEAQGGSSVFSHRWLGPPPLNIAPLFSAGHIVGATALDRFLIEGFYNRHAMQLVEQLFGLSGLWVGQSGSSTAESVFSTKAETVCQKERSSVFQVPVSDARLAHCLCYGDLVCALMELETPLLAMGLFRYPEGIKSSYSLLVSLEAAEELDFRAPNFGQRITYVLDDIDEVLQSPGVSTKSLTPVIEAGKTGQEDSLRSDESEGRTHRLPFVITNPAQDLELFDTDLVFVLGQGFPSDTDECRTPLRIDSNMSAQTYDSSGAFIDSRVTL